MDLSEITFRNSLDEDLNIESWIDTTINFKNESLVEVSLLNSKKDKIKVDKKNIISKAIERKKFKKNKKAVNRKLSDNHKKDDDIISSGRTSLILRSL
ncbi:hypothetical protein CPHLJ_3g2845 [Cryptosporidium parvum]|uniref:Uncharacterized protein n=1 Tax=Cryptosporidium parvum TaxID=5807 RepID=A0A7S7LIL3_CRYPV|nr:hypothetical protein CPATCC_0033860 [Cryptosporidium parvum]WKS77031.1 hypothetical protein CPCDC_3g2845 [Cryptosporidium sp. 43IA8]WRK31523.1 hypothetical protein cpbgf_3002843 [Cryptosporidium parvum]|eukprot:QOY42638.1 hypothetical protein CPATCC_001291 [Cryptosporidium parvum]